MVSHFILPVILSSVILVQTSSDFSECLAIKNNRERLKCYDDMALNNSKRGSSSTFQSTTDPNSLTLNQKNEISTAIRALRKMVSITETGVNQREYASRLLDMTTTVDEALHNIPECQLKTNILRSKKAYVDANRFWDDLNKLSFINTFLESYAPELKEYEIDIGRLKSPDETYSKKYEIERAYAVGKASILNDVWAKGRKYLEDADALLQAGRLNP
jgi:hypothetical protein